MFKKLIPIVVASVALFTLAYAPPASALLNQSALRDEACAGITGDDSNANATTSCSSDANPFNVVNVIIDILSVIVGVVAVIFLIIGGFRYITSGGDSGKIGSAKSTILYAVIGLLIVALAQFIVNIVLSQSRTITDPPAESGMAITAGK